MTTTKMTRNKMARWGWVTAVLAGLSLSALPLVGADVDTSRLPPASDKKADFAKDIKPLLKKSCQECHAADGPMGKFRVDDYELLMKGGSSGKAVIPGKSDKSPLIHYVAGLVPDMQMPPEGEGAKLTKEQIALLRAWIDQGAKGDAANSKEPVKKP